MEETPPVILACGLSTYDLIYYAAEIAAPNQKITAESANFGAGGPALNAAITIAQLTSGQPAADRVRNFTVKLISSVGHGPFAELIATECAQYAVELHDYAPASAQPPISSVVVNHTGERSVVSLNARGQEGVNISAASVQAAIQGANILLVDGHHLPLAIPLAKAAHSAGIFVVLDGGSWKPGLEKLLPFVHLAAVSADFQAPADLATYGVRWVIKTQGADPVQITDTRREHHHEITPPTPAVVADTLGAGDVFHGALVYALAAELCEQPEVTWELILDAATQATGIASESVTHRGPRLQI